MTKVKYGAHMTKVKYKGHMINVKIQGLHDHGQIQRKIYHCFKIF